MGESYKLTVRLGPNEFVAEGPEEQVKEDYQRFLDAIREVAPAAPTAPARSVVPVVPSVVAALKADSAFGAEIDRATLDRVYSVEGGIVSLRLLPNDTATREADAAILILYGFRAMRGDREVLVTRLNEGLRRSGLNVDRLDRFMGVHSGLFMRGGARSGGRYTLNNVGVQTAETWLRTRFQ